MNARRTGRPRRRWFRVLAIVLGFLLGFALVEGIGAIGLHLASREPELPEEVRRVVRTTDRSVETIPDPYLLYRVKPGIRKSHVETNAYSLRNGPIERLPGPDTYRVLLLGGSVAWGYSSTSNADTIAAYLQAWLTERRERSTGLTGRRVEVLNGGMGAYDGWQAALSYAIYHRALRPHAVVTLDGTNQVSAAIILGRAGWPMQFDPELRSHAKTRRSLFASLRSWAVYRATHLKSVLFVRELFPSPLEDFDPPEPEAVAEAYRGALVLLADVARLEGALPMAVLQPMCLLPETKPLTPYEEAVVQHHEQKMRGRNGYYRRCFDAHREMFAKLREERPDLHTFDATEVFADDPRPLYTDVCHLTPDGRRRLAAAIGERLLEATARRQR